MRKWFYFFIFFVAEILEMKTTYLVLMPSTALAQYLKQHCESFI
jgi:hypothetical protein